MFAITVSEKGGESRRQEFDKAEITIGRVQGNDIILPKGNVSKRHSRIVFKDGKFIIVDLKSTNGTYVNGRKITSPIVVKSTDKVYIGDFVLVIEDPAAEAAADPGEKHLASTLPPPPPPGRVATARPAEPSEDEVSGEQDSIDDYDSLPQGPDVVDEEVSDAAIETQAPAAAPPPAPAPSAGMRTTQPVPGIRPPRPTVMGDPARAAVPGPASASPISVSIPKPAAPYTPPRPRDRAPVPASAPGVPQPTTRPQLSQPVSASPTPSPAAPSATAPAPRPPTTRATSGAVTGIAPSTVSGIPQVNEAAAEPHTPRAQDALVRAVTRLSEQFPAEANALGRPEVAVLARAERVAREAIAGADLPAGVDAESVARDAVAEVLGAGPLDALLSDPSVEEIRVPRPDRVLVVQRGRVQTSGRAFSSVEGVRRAARRLAPHAGERSFVTTLADGTTLSATASGGLLLRRPSPTPSLTALAADGALSAGMADFLTLAVAVRRGVVVSGVSESGRERFAAALAAAADPAERIVGVGFSSGLLPEAAFHLAAEGSDLSPRALGANRVVLGASVDGARVPALAAEHPGLVAVAPGVDAADAFDRIAVRAGLSLNAQAAREALVGFASVVVHVEQIDGRLRVSRIGELLRFDERGRAIVTDVFVRRGDGFIATGHVPSFASSAPSTMFGASANG